MPLAVLLLLPAAVAPIVIVGYEEYEAGRMERNERAAIEALRTISGTQVRFREGDRDKDNILDYATTLAELGQAGLIDNQLAAGFFKGYKFGLKGSTFDWLATATPISERSGHRNFIICTDGVVRFSTTGTALCSHVTVQ